MTYQALNFTLQMLGRLDEALTAGRRSVDLGPNDAENHIFLARAQTSAGRYAEAVVSSETAMRLNPFPPIYYHFLHGRALYSVGEYVEAERVSKFCVSRMPKFIHCRAFLIAAAIELGHTDDAQAHARVLLEHRPTFTLETARRK